MSPGWSLVGSQGAWLSWAGTGQGKVEAASARDIRQESCGQGLDLRGNIFGNSRVRHCARCFSNILFFLSLSSDDSDRHRVREATKGRGWEVPPCQSKSNVHVTSFLKNEIKLERKKKKKPRPSVADYGRESAKA